SRSSIFSRCSPRFLSITGSSDERRDHPHTSTSARSQAPQYCNRAVHRGFCRAGVLRYYRAHARRFCCGRRYDMNDLRRKRVIHTAAMAIGAVVGMTAMAFAAVPLYRAFCQATGYGGTTQVARAAPSRVLAQTLQVRFDTNVATDLPITFTPKQASET